MENEEWRWIQGFEGKYEISNFGRVKSHYRLDGPRIKKGVVDPRGYVAIVTGAKPRRLFRIHRLVAQAFIPNPHNFNEVNHIDGVKGNNHYSNLEWCTRSQNCKHSYDTGLKRHIARKGEASHFAKMTADQVLEIRMLYSYGTVDNTFSEIARRYNVYPSTIRAIVTRQSWSHI